MARRYNRDSRGRFASGGGGGGSRRPAPRGISRGTNRLTRDNSGRITSVGGDGATARGGRLRTASGKQRGTQTARISGGRASGTVTRSGARRTAVKPAKPQPSASAPKMTRAQYEAAAAKAWGRKPSSSTSKKKQSQDEQLDRLAELSGKRVQSRTGLSKSEAMKASDLGKATGRRVEVSQNAFGGYSVRVAGRAAATPTKPTTRAAAAAVKPARKSIGSISEAKASRIIARLDANRSGIRRATGTARQTANSIRTRERAVAFALAPGARARKKGQNISTNESLQRAVKNASKNRAAKAATSKSTAAAAAKPAKGSAAAQKIEQAKGRTKVLTQSKNALNQQLKAINAQIKQAGPSAGGLRLQKLQIQDRLSQLRRDIAASKAAARG